MMNEASSGPIAVALETSMVYLLVFHQQLGV
jgi:hypothetical protein